jgi:hypothetical protein
MPDSKPISELITAEQTSGSDLFETAIPNTMTETGYISRKVTANALALLFNNTLQFSSQLQTTAKTLIGAINELAQGGGGGGASVAMGTTDPSASSGSNGDLYIKYDGTSYEVLAMFVKISGDWREIETGGGGGGGASSLDDLSDVDVDTTTLATGQMLVYNGTSGKFENASVSGNGHTYSTTEQVVGTWIDGSTLYERTFVSNALVSGNNEVGDFSDVTPSLIWVEKGFVVSQGASIPNMYYTDNDADHIKIYVRQTDNTVRCICSNYYAGGICYAIIRYTKSST